jgi:hypothetical protein
MRTVLVSHKRLTVAKSSASVDRTHTAKVKQANRAEEKKTFFERA